MKRIILAVLVAASGAALAGAPASRVDAAMAAADKEMIDAAIQIVRWGLIDPESSRFRSVSISPGGHAVCGEYNSKNRLGGYVGFPRFIVRVKSLTVDRPGSRSRRQNGSTAV